MGTTTSLPTLSAFFAGQPFNPLSAPWIGFFNALLEASGLSGGSAQSAVTVWQQTLAAPATVISVPEPSTDGQLLYVRLVQSVTGGNQITWDTMFDPSTPVDINTIGGKAALFQFVAIGGGWICSGVFA